MKKFILTALLSVCAILVSCVANSAEPAIATLVQPEEHTAAPAVITEQAEDESVATETANDMLNHDWGDIDGDGEEESVETVDFRKFSLDEIFRDDTLTQLYIDQLEKGEINHPALEEIIKYPVLSEWFVEEKKPADYQEWHDTPQSTCFSKIAYTPVFCYLDVIFRDSGAEYRYYNVPDYVFNEFKNADSLGRYYNEYIKGSYDCERID